MDSAGRTRATLPTLLLCALAGILVACSSESSDSAPDELTLDEFLGFDAAAAATAYADCLRAKGWVTELDPGGGAVTEVPEEQYPEFDRASSDCQQAVADAGLTPDPSRPPSEALLRYFYDESMAYHVCLEENGYPTTEAPSWEVYRSNFGVDGWLWVPDSALVEAAQRSGDSESLVRAGEDCPPPDEGG